MLTCPNGCTDHDERPVEMEFDFVAEQGGKPGYRCPGCGWAELQSGRGRL